MKKLLLCSALSLTAISSANAELSMSAGVLYHNDLYHGYNRNFYPLPIIDYDSAYFFFRGLTGGYYLYNTVQDQFALTVNYSLFSFRPNASHDLAMKHLDKRKTTIMSGFTYQHNDAWGNIRFSLLADTLDNRSKGFVGDLAYFYSLTIDQSDFSIGGGVNWNSRQFNNYYFGISQAESMVSGLPYYHTNNSWSPYLEMGMKHKFTQEWSTQISTRITRLANEVHRSPMVDNHYIGSFFAGIRYQF